MAKEILETGKLGKSLRNNWAWIASMGYLDVTYVGMIQSWKYFDAFGINVFEFAELNDFLLSAFREPMSFLYLGAFFVYPLVFLIVTKFRAKKSGKSLREHGQLKSTIFDHRLSPTIATFGLLFFAVIAPYFIPNFWKGDVLEDPARKYRVLFGSTIHPERTRQWRNDLVFIGTTEKYMFFVRTLEQTNGAYYLHISPVQNVVLMRRERADVIGGQPVNDS